MTQTNIPPATAQLTSPTTPAKPPIAAKRPHTLESHGHKRIDEYYWMRDRDEPEVIDWLEAENAYRTDVMLETEPLQAQLVKELRERIKQDDESAHYPDRGYNWYHRTFDGQQYEVHYRRKLAANGRDEIGEEELVLDENKIAEGHAYCEIPLIERSPDGQIVAWAVDTVGRRFFNIQFRDLSSGQMLADSIPDTTGNLVFAEDGKHVLYSRQDPNTLRSDRVFRHRLGTDSASDQLVFFEADEEYNVHVAPTKSRKYIQIVSEQTLTTETRLIDSETPEAELVVFLPRERDHEYSIDHLDGRFVIRSNWNAPNFCLFETTAAGGDKSTWKVLLPHDRDSYVQDFELLADWLVVQERFNGLTRIRYRKHASRDFQTLDFGQPCYEANLAATTDPKTDRLRYHFSSFKTPPSIMEIDLATATKSVIKQQEVLGGFDERNYITERLWATARDGVQVPVAIIRHKDTPVDGTAPLLVYGYGSYGISMEDEFVPDNFNLIDRGFVYAVAHIRGGQEMGRSWYEDGKLLKKVNTFTDFIDATKHLVANKIADPKRVYARGGSAGGLLMGAVTNLAGDLYHGIIADVPFVDVVTTMLDDSIPLTTFEYDEWGNPNDEQYYRYMLSYSPYDNVQQKAYPNMLVTTGLHDSQVQYWEPAKWVARLRELKTDKNLLFLDTEMHAGHGGTSGRYDRYKEHAKRQAFLLMLAGIKS